MTMLAKLENYYRKRGILSTAFNCEHKRACCGGLKPTPESVKILEEACGTFTPAKSAYVGEHYGDRVARLLFVSSDPGGAVYHPEHYNFASAESRTPKSVRKIETIGVDKLGFGRSTQWRRVHEMTRAILDLSIPKAEKALPYFAHMNAAKCCRNRHNKAEAGNNLLFQNCRKYLRGEINILAPDIVVTQGAWAKEGVEHVFSISSEWGREQIVRLSNERELLWFPSYHPSSYGPYKKQEDARNRFIVRAREWAKVRAS